MQHHFRLSSHTDPDWDDRLHILVHHALTSHCWSSQSENQPIDSGLTSQELSLLLLLVFLQLSNLMPLWRPTMRMNQLFKIRTVDACGLDISPVLFMRSAVAILFLISIGMPWRGLKLLMESSIDILVYTPPQFFESSLSIEAGCNLKSIWVKLRDGIQSTINFSYSSAIGLESFSIT